MTISWPRKVSAALIVAALWGLATGLVGASWAVAKKDATYEAQMKEVASVKGDVDAIKLQINKMQEDVAGLKTSDRFRAEAIEEIKETGKSIEEKLDKIRDFLMRNNSTVR